MPRRKGWCWVSRIPEDSRGPSADGFEDLSVGNDGAMQQLKEERLKGWRGKYLRRSACECPKCGGLMVPQGIKGRGPREIVMVAVCVDCQWGAEEHYRLHSVEPVSG